MVRSKNSRKHFDEKLNQSENVDSFYQNSKVKSSKPLTIAEKDMPNNLKKKTKIEKKDEKDLFNETNVCFKNSSSFGKPLPPSPVLQKRTKFFGNEFSVNNNSDKKVITFMEENEKDEDTEEFFQLIQETVEVAVKKSLKDLLDKHLKSLNSKITDVSDTLKATEFKFEKIKNELNNKISHYGEETSRHFRYLCMKSEYDKMFYQHQSMVAMATESRPNIYGAMATGSQMPMAKESGMFPPQVFPASQQQQWPPASNETERTMKPMETPAVVKCTCKASAANHDRVEAEGKFQSGHGHGDGGNNKASTSELGLRDLLEQIQLFYPQLCRTDKSAGKANDSPRSRLDIGDEDSVVDGDDDDNDSSQVYLPYPSPNSNKK